MNIFRKLFAMEISVRRGKQNTFPMLVVDFFLKIR